MSDSTHPDFVTEDTTTSILSHLITEETTASIIRMLTEREAIVIALKAEGLSDKAIADEADMTVSAVRSALADIRARVRERVEAG